MNQNIPLNISPKELNKILEDDSSEKPFIVDVREDNEIAIASFSFSVLHLPLSKAANWSAKLVNCYRRISLLSLSAMRV